MKQSDRRSAFEQRVKGTKSSLRAYSTKYLMESIPKEPYL